MASQASAANRDPEETGTLHNPDIFSDQYAESLAESYADSGHPPSIKRSDSPVSPISVDDDGGIRELRSSFAQTVIPSSQAIHPHRSPSMRQSLSKSPRASGQQNERGQELDTGSNSRGINTTMPFPAAHRSSSSASTHSFAGSQSPVTPGDGPSHPYGMYPQGLGVSRTASVATASTTRPSSQNLNGRTPAHPNSLLSQNVAGDATDGNQTTSIPVGFPGAGQSFHRQIGAEGEEQDIIGSDGHTEQLPPYSRFADETNHKTIAGGALPAIGEGDGPNPQPASPTVSERTGGERESLATGNSDTARLHRSSVPVGDNSERAPMEKSWSERNWREKRRTKVLGVPLWIFLLVVAILLSIAAICGGVIGGVLGHNKAKHTTAPPGSDSNDPASATTPTATVTETRLLDASPVATTPAGLPSLPSGTFVSSIGNPYKQQSNCMTDPGQAQAWNCTLTPETLDITIDTSGPRPQMQLSSVSNSTINYGAQPPNTNITGLQLVWDMGQMNSGPAYQFQTLYQKEVVLPLEALGPMNSKSRRSPHYVPYPFPGAGLGGDDAGSPSFESRDVDDSSASWFCYWPATFLEAFVYVNESSATSNSATNDSASPTASSTTASSTTISSPSYPHPSVSTPPFLSAGPPDGTMPTGNPRPFSNSIYQQRGWHSEWGPPSNWKRDGNGSATDCPKRVKIEERRLQIPQNNAFCIKKQFQNSQWQSMTDEDGNPITVQLSETDPGSPNTSQKQRRAANNAMNKSKRGPTPNSCYCQWNNWSQ